MKKTTFAGITILDPGEGLDTDNSAFTGPDREAIDHFLRLGAKLHRHNGSPGLSNPLSTPSGAIIASGGTIAPEVTLSLGYTLEDAQGGETQISPLATTSTGPPLSVPTAAPSAAFTDSAGSLMVNTYYYGLTWADGEGGETPLGPTVGVERPPGFASGQIELSNLAFGMVGAGAVEWRLYRAIGGGVFNLLGTGNSSSNIFTDDGTVSADCDVQPPLNSENTTRHVNTLKVTLPPSDPNMASASLINLYVSTDGSFGGATLLDSYPLASAGKSAVYRGLELQDQSPPDVNRSVGGANQIDPDTELLDWHWKRPVLASANLGSGALGDVRLVETTGHLYGVLSPLTSAGKPSEWTRLASGAGSVLNTFASGSAVAPNEGTDISRIEIFGSGGINAKGSEVSGTYQLTLEGQAATLGQEGMGVIVHKANASAIRPKAFRQYTWMGSVKPNNMAEYDIWVEA
jgi:hypothetical protein